MKLTLDRLDLRRACRNKNCSKVKFDDLLPEAQAAVRAVGKATFREYDRSNYNAVYPPKEDRDEV